MKIRTIKFENHPILGNINLDFTDENGNTVNTIILAGENGTGKSVTLNTIFEFSNYSIDESRGNEKRNFEIELNSEEIKILEESEYSKQYFSQPIKNNILFVIANLFFFDLKSK